ncbi:leucyl aminopeptidase [Mycoplasmatota bacterium]|nr:leucyl aminopeptidase [Mycoplasmatota bacterium]
MKEYISNLKLETETKAIVMGIHDENQNRIIEPIINNLSERKEIYRFGEITVFYPIDQFKTKKFIFIGLGKKEKYYLQDIQSLFSKIAKAIDCDTVIDIDSFQCLESNIHLLCEKAVETIDLVNYRFNDYKTNNVKEESFEISIYSKEDVSQAILTGSIYARGTNSARNLVNEPRNKMTPSILADYAKDLAKEHNLSCDIYNKKEIEALGMGAFLAVNQGSKEEAKLIHLKYRNAENDPVTALIGKGLTYDSGGYSLKPKNGMAGMKSDMGGAASVLGAIEIIARKQMKVNVDVIIAATENLINSEAIVPDDVIVTMNGKTIEVLNTDAEGRLTLVDAVTYAKENNASKIIDVATLTGGVVTALGTDITGAFTNNNDLLSEIKETSVKAGEAIWQLPVDAFREKCKKSDVADYNNSPGREGHASFGAAIIAEFAEETPWVHLDIAGTCTKKASHLLGPSGATGVIVRTLAKIFE